MGDAANLTRERILAAAEELLRRHGPAKTTVSDVARALGMSHANVYRHFASKADLRDAVAERWLHAVSAPLAAIAAGPPAADGCSTGCWRWPRPSGARSTTTPSCSRTTMPSPGRRAASSPGMWRGLQDQLAGIVRDGIARGEFAPIDPDAAAAAVLDATLRFHHPQHVREAVGGIFRRSAPRHGAAAGWAARRRELAGSDRGPDRTPVVSPHRENTFARFVRKLTSKRKPG